MKKISIVLALALVLAMAVPAMAVDIAGEVEFERAYVDEDDSYTVNSIDIDLDFTANPAANVETFVGVELEDIVDGNIDSNNVEVDEAWINVDLLELPGASLKAGRFGVATPQDLLYDLNLDGAELSYAVDNIAVSFASDLDNDDSIKFIEASMSDLVFGEVTSVATLNIADYGIDDEDTAFSIALDNSHEMADFYVVFADDQESAFQLGAETDVLAPGLTVGFDYGQMDEDYLGEADFFDDFTDFADEIGYIYDDIQTIVFGAEYDVNDVLSTSFEYAMHEDDADAELDVLTLGAEYDLAENTVLEFEFENYDAGDEDVDVITTTLTTNF
ncbi:porin [Natroniella acetigena]|uniref:porin n=1 Tax=Natroniella acetigena TaxID=52004 RepID=UPI00200B62B6|nr:porin [Natroniella acetigena]MCK8827309.1 porin [Natroniella acetigena]